MELLRQLIADHIERLIEFLNLLDGDPDLEPDVEIGILDMPHDADDEGDDEPWLGFTENGSCGGRSWCIDGELDEVDPA